MKRIACIGTRELGDATVLLEAIGAYLVRAGYTVSTGNAIGSDQAFARGGNSVDPKRVELWLPWASYERAAVVKGNIVHTGPTVDDVELAKKLHPAWGRCSAGARTLHARNCQIVRGCTLVIALPRRDCPGGTGQGMRIAEHLGIPVHNLRIGADFGRIVAKLREAGYEDFHDDFVDEWVSRRLTNREDTQELYTKLGRRSQTDELVTVVKGEVQLTRTPGKEGFFTSVSNPTVAGTIQHP